MRPYNIDFKGLALAAKKSWFGLVSMGISAVVLLIFLLRAGGISAMAAQTAGMRKEWVAAMIVCTFLFWLTDGLILHVYIRLKYKKYRFTRTFRTAMVGLLYNCLTPFATGGQPMQVYDMTQGGIDAGDAVSYVTAKAMVYQICLTLCAIAALFFSLSVFRARIPHFEIFLWLGMAVNLIFIVAAFVVVLNKNAAVALGLSCVNALARFRLVKNREKSAEAVLRQIGLFHQSFTLICRKKGALIGSLLATLLQLALYYSLTYLIYRSFNLSGSAFPLILSAQALLTLITAFVPMPGGSGAAETGFYIFFSIFFPKAVIAPAVFIWRILTYYACILVGGAVSLCGRGARRASSATG